ncbi:tumor necrosis factor receptor superfamily member 18 [Melozone crissalis]|uniref:tumor necrosis factor receptor superfamily member 18 n=1 Tax=Melozone crissalis TaxID=40204 RepID=UPI0023DA3288|nr:tumor necrosis factor receptor superfamily member 18 [Melozone crissalis]
MARALLWLLLAGHWAGLGRAGQCQDGELRVGWGGDTKCCPKCTWKAGNPAPCKEAEPDLDCQCPPGYGCSGDPCQYCRNLPQCEAGWELSRIGSQNFLIECKRCENGTFSSTRDSWCRNWTDCGSRGLGTRRAGNSSHDSECGPPAPAREPAPVALEFPSSTILAILVAVAVFVLVLLTFLLHFCIWSLHRDPNPAADSGPTFPRLPPRPAQGEECSSIQFPEEEHGDKSEEKLSVLSLKVYSELR